MDLVDEQDVAGVQIGQQRRQVAGLLDGGAGGDADIDPHLVGDDARQGGLAQARRAVEQHVVQGLAAAAGGFNIDGEIVLGLLLAGIVGEGARTQGEFPVVAGRQAGGHQRRVKIRCIINAHGLLLT